MLKGMRKFVPVQPLKGQKNKLWIRIKLWGGGPMARKQLSAVAGLLDPTGVGGS